MNKRLNISAEHLHLIRKILQQHLSPNARVWAFGSRVSGTARKYSDLDLLIDNHGYPLSMETHSKLVYDFDESCLPYKIDMTDFTTVDSIFKKNIDNHKISILAPH